MPPGLFRDKLPWPVRVIPSGPAAVRDSRRIAPGCRHGRISRELARQRNARRQATCLTGNPLARVQAAERPSSGDVPGRNPAGQGSAGPHGSAGIARERGFSRRRGGRLEPDEPATPAIRPGHGTAGNSQQIMEDLDVPEQVIEPDRPGPPDYPTVADALPPPASRAIEVSRISRRCR